MSVSIILLIVAAVCFALAAIGIAVDRLNLVAAGLFAWVLSQLIV